MRCKAQAQRLSDPERRRELQLCDIADDWAKRHVPTTLGYGMRLQSANSAPEPQRTRDIQGIQAEVDRFTRTRDKNYDGNIEAAAAQAWPKYQARIDDAALGIFRKFMSSLDAQANALCDRRTASLIQWLEASLFIDTLEASITPTPKTACSFRT